MILNRDSNPKIRYLQLFRMSSIEQSIENNTRSEMKQSSTNVQVSPVSEEIHSKINTLTQNLNSGAIDQSVFTREVAKLIAASANNKRKRRRTPASEEEKAADAYLATVKSIFNSLLSKSYTSTPQLVRDHFKRHFIESVLKEQKPDLVTEEVLLEAISEAEEASKEKREKHNFYLQKKLTIAIKDAACNAGTHTKLPDEYKHAMFRALRTIPSFPNSDYMGKDADEKNEEARDLFESAVEHGKEAAAKELESRRAASEKRKRKSKRDAAMKKAKNQDSQSPNSSEGEEEV